VDPAINVLISECVLSCRICMYIHIHVYIYMHIHVNVCIVWWFDLNFI
jgi:hypothetical protein